MSRNYIYFIRICFHMIEMKIKEKEFDFNQGQDDEIMKQLINRRIQYFSNVLLKYLKMRKYASNDETPELTHLISSLENIGI